MQILINCCRVHLGNHMNTYLKDVFDKKPVIIHGKHPQSSDELQMPVYTSELETCLEQMADRVKELCGIWDFKTDEAVFNDMKNYVQSIAMWSWCLKMIHEKYPNKKDIEIIFTSAIRGSSDYFTKQHIERRAHELHQQRYNYY